MRRRELEFFLNLVRTRDDFSREYVYAPRRSCEGRYSCVNRYGSSIMLA